MAAHYCLVDGSLEEEDEVEILRRFNWKAFQNLPLDALAIYYVMDELFLCSFW